MMLLNKNAKEAAAAAAASTPPDPSGQDMSQSFAALLTAPDDEIQKKEASKKSQKIGITFLKSHQKELSKMPQLLQSKIKKAILRKPRFHNGAYEKRACIDGIMQPLIISAFYLRDHHKLSLSMLYHLLLRRSSPSSLNYLSQSFDDRYLFLMWGLNLKILN